MRVALRAALIVACACLVAWPGAAGAQQSDRIVFAGLRPAGDRAFKRTEIRRLQEAQRLRAILEEGTRELTGQTVIDHAALHAILGSSYLVKLIGCAGDVACIGGALARLRRHSSKAVYGDYAVERGQYRVRMRVIDLASLEVLAERAFSLPANAIDDRARWKRELSALFASVDGMVGSAPSGAGEGGTAKEGATEPAGPAGKPAPTSGGEQAGGAASSGQAGESTGSGRDTDELTDADFGVAAPPPPNLTVARRPDPPMLEVSSGVSLVTRRFRFDSEEGVDMSDGFKSAWTSRVGGALAVYPLGLLGRDRFTGLGVLAAFGRTLSSGSGSSSVRDTRLYLGLAYRIPIGRSARYPTFQVSAGYLREDVVALDSSLEFPDTGYRGASFGGAVHMPILTPRVAVNAGLEYLIVPEAGQIVEPTYYGRSKVGGIAVEGSLEVRPLESVFVRLGGSYTSFDFELGERGERSNLGAIGAQDRLVAATVTTGLLLY